ncbi:MAG: universal stress protein [Bacteroidia bacterium]
MPTLTHSQHARKPYRLPEQIETILVPTDFSEASANAFRYALDLASRLQAEIVLAHIYTPAEGSPSKTQSESFARAFKGYERAAELSAGPAELKIRTVLEAGTASKDLLEISDEQKADLIVMGTQGAASHDSKPLGSIAATMIAEAPCPVLAVPAEASYQAIDQLVYAMAFASSDQKIIDYLVELSEQLETSLSCVHVSTEHSDWEDIELEEFRQAFSQGGKTLVRFQMVQDKDLFHGLQEVISQTKVDLLVMNTRDRSLFERFFDPSLTKSMLMYTDLPLLALHV